MQVLLLLLLLSSPRSGAAASHVCLTAAALHYCFHVRSAVAMRLLQSKKDLYYGDWRGSMTS
jgi:hypothetical protein